MGRRRSMLLRLLPPPRRSSSGNTSMQYPWKAPGTPPAALHHRREQLLKMNLSQHSALREEWAELIQALDAQLHDEVTRRSTDSPEDSASIVSSSDERGSSAEGRDVQLPYDLQHASFLSEYLDDAGPVRMPGSPATPEREHSNPLTAGILPGTLPDIQLFSESDFTPSEDRLAEVARQRGPALNPYRPAHLSMMPLTRPASASASFAPVCARRSSTKAISLSTTSGSAGTSAVTMRPGTSAGSTTAARKRRSDGTPDTNTTSTRVSAPTATAPKTKRKSSGTRARGLPRVATLPNPRASRPASATPAPARPPSSLSRSPSSHKSSPPKKVMRPASAAPASTRRTGSTGGAGGDVGCAKRASGKTPQPLSRGGRTGPVAIWATPDVSICGRK
eukprot:m.59572 g.59572  ORF g.59572 m.59572 type:complete len:392 (+) comp7901_c0_seq2:252-1427(+)